MIVMRVAARLSSSFSLSEKISRSLPQWTPRLVFQNKYYQHTTPSFYSNKSKDKIMVDPKHVVSYEDMLKVIQQPEKVIIDVRNPDEIINTGKIPSSINIPLNNIQDTLTSMSDADFQKNFNRNKPSSRDELIFYCRSGRRSTEALDTALKLGYTNSKTYLGSWDEWASRKR